MQVEDTGRAQAEIKGLNYVAMERVNKLEGILTSQIVRLVSELRGDPYEVLLSPPPTPPHTLHSPSDPNHTHFNTMTVHTLWPAYYVRHGAKP